MTATGPRPVEELVPGDLVLTKDRGLQPLAWTGRRRFSLADQLAQPALVPVCIAARVLLGADQRQGSRGLRRSQQMEYGCHPDATCCANTAFLR